MHKIAIIENGVVTNIALYEAIPDGGIEAIDCNIGDLWDGQVFTARPVPAPVVPESVSPRQIREALMDVGLFDTVDGAVAASGDRKLQNWWEFATEFQRTNPHVLAMAQALGVTDAQLDGIWILAGSL